MFQHICHRRQHNADTLKSKLEWKNVRARIRVWVRNAEKKNKEREEEEEKTQTDQSFQAFSFFHRIVVCVCECLPKRW